MINSALEDRNMTRRSPDRLGIRSRNIRDNITIRIRNVLEETGTGNPNIPMDLLNSILEVEVVGMNMGTILLI